MELYTYYYFIYFFVKDETGMISLNAVRLCFQVIIYPEGQETPLLPIYSDVIKNELKIVDISDKSSPVTGGKKILLLCEGLQGLETTVRFIQKDSEGNIMWKTEIYGQDMLVHRQSGISFKTPKYKCQDIKKPVEVFVQLYRTTDQVESQLISFQFTPVESSKFFLLNKPSKNLINFFIYLLFSANGTKRNMNIPVNIENQAQQRPWWFPSMDQGVQTDPYYTVIERTQMSDQSQSQQQSRLDILHGIDIQRRLINDRLQRYMQGK